MSVVDLLCSNTTDEPAL